MEVLPMTAQRPTLDQKKVKMRPAIESYSMEELKSLKDQIDKQLKIKKNAEVKAESNELKQKYPNPWKRALVNIWLIITSLPKAIAKGILRIANQRSAKRFGLDISAKNHLDRRANKYDFTVSPSRNQTIDYKVVTHKEGPNKKERIIGYQTTMKNSDGKSTCVFIDANSKINKNQAVDLLCGRSIKVSGNTWLVPNLNDKDPNGNIKLKEIDIVNFNIKDSLARKFGSSINRDQLEKLAAGMEAGKRMDLTVKIGRKEVPLKIELSPIQRDFKLFNENNQPTKIESIKQAKNTKGISNKKSKEANDIPQSQNGQFRKLITPK